MFLCVEQAAKYANSPHGERHCMQQNDLFLIWTLHNLTYTMASEVQMVNNNGKIENMDKDTPEINKGVLIDT